MDSVEEQILSYPHLPVEEKREVESYVESHPKWASLLADVRAWAAFEDGRPLSASILRAYVVVQYTERDPKSDAFERSRDRIEAALEEDPALRTRADEIRKQLAEAEAGLDPVSHFESVTGHSLSTASDDADSRSASRSPDDADSRSPNRSSALRSLIDSFLNLSLAARGVGVTLVLLFVSYITLFLVSWSSQSSLDRLATVDVSTQMIESYYSNRTRGAAPSADTLTTGTLYLNTLSTLREARSSTLGLFPRYQTDSLRKAKAGLKRVLTRTEEGTFLALEAHFYLGKVHLAQGHVPKARSCFKIVVEGGSRRADEARRILKALADEQDGVASDRSSAG